MEVPVKIRAAAERLKKGHRINRITVRDFLRHFGAERRGAVKVEAIQRILDNLGLATDPDFATAWIDAPLWLILKEGVAVTPSSALTMADEDSMDDELADVEDVVLEGTPSAVQQSEEYIESAPLSLDDAIPNECAPLKSASQEDPTFRIGSLPAANKKLIVVGSKRSPNESRDSHASARLRSIACYARRARSEGSRDVEVYRCQENSGM